MKINDGRETAIGVTSFKARCLAIIDDVAKGKTSWIVLVKHNRPVAAIVPIETQAVELWGALRGTVTITPGTDLTEGTGETGDAER